MQYDTHVSMHLQYDIDLSTQVLKKRQRVVEDRFRRVCVQSPVNVYDRAREVVQYMSFYNSLDARMPMYDQFMKMKNEMIMLSGVYSDIKYNGMGIQYHNSKIYLGLVFPDLCQGIYYDKSFFTILNGVITPRYHPNEVKNEFSTLFDIGGSYQMKFDFVEGLKHTISFPITKDFFFYFLNTNNTYETCLRKYVSFFFSYLYNCVDLIQIYRDPRPFIDVKCATLIGNLQRTCICVEEDICMNVESLMVDKIAYVHSNVFTDFFYDDLVGQRGFLCNKEEGIIYINLKIGEGELMSAIDNTDSIIDFVNNSSGGGSVKDSIVHNLGRQNELDVFSSKDVAIFIFPQGSVCRVSLCQQCCDAFANTDDIKHDGGFYIHKRKEKFKVGNIDMMREYYIYEYKWGDVKIFCPQHESINLYAKNVHHRCPHGSVVLLSANDDYIPNVQGLLERCKTQNIFIEEIDFKDSYLPIAHYGVLYNKRAGVRSPMSHIMYFLDCKDELDCNDIVMEDTVESCKNQILSATKSDRIDRFLTIELLMCVLTNAKQRSVVEKINTGVSVPFQRMYEAYVNDPDLFCKVLSGSHKEYFSEECCIFFSYVLKSLLLEKDDGYMSSDDLIRLILSKIKYSFWDFICKCSEVNKGSKQKCDKCSECCNYYKSAFKNKGVSFNTAVAYLGSDHDYRCGGSCSNNCRQYIFSRFQMMYKEIALMTTMYSVKLFDKKHRGRQFDEKLMWKYVLNLVNGAHLIKNKLDYSILEVIYMCGFYFQRHSWIGCVLDFRACGLVGVDFFT